MKFLLGLIRSISLYSSVGPELSVGAMANYYSNELSLYANSHVYKAT